jgi:uncharacterized protein
MKTTVKCILGTLLIMCVQQLSAQSVPTHSPNSKEILSKGIDLYEKGEYKEAAKHFSTIHRNDSSYMLSLYEKALVLQQDSAYVEALANINLALAEEQTASIHDYLVLKANILDDMGKGNEALLLYDYILTLFPASTQVKSQKITTLFRLKRYDEAEALARECVVANFLSPLYHYKLGYVAYTKGKIVPALMAFMMAQIVNPSHNNRSRVVTYLVNICNAKDETLEAQQQRTGDYPENFNRVEQIIFSKIALEKGYKVKFNLDDNIFKQVNVMMEKLEFDEASDDPYMQLYVPYFKKVFQEKKAEVMLNHAFSSLEIETIDSYVKKNKSDVSSFGSEAFNYVDLIRTTRVINYQQRQNSPKLYHFDEGQFFGYGKLAGENGEGAWTFYFPDGHVSAVGELLSNERNGQWKFYYENGKLQSVEQYSKGLSNGPVTAYYQSGVVKRTASYKDGKLEGVVKNYSLFGVLLSDENYLADEYHGTVKNYYNDGRLKAEYSYKNGKLNGPYAIYYANKTVKEQGNYTDGEPDGEFKEFFSNGKLKTAYQYSNGKTSGTWKYFHANGKPEYTIDMSDKGAQGEVTTYDERGNIVSKQSYKDGNSIGISEYYHNGKVYVTYKNNSKGKVSEVRYIDSVGNEKLVNKRSSKTWPITYYSPYGFKLSDKQFNQDERLTNEAIYYSSQGEKIFTEQYEDGELNGVVQSLYYNKKQKEETEYKAGKKNGISKTYFANGKLSAVSFYSDDVLEDYQYEYASNGILLSKYFYSLGEKNGHCISYYANGNPFYEEKYVNGWIKEVKQFDTTGNPMKPIRFEDGKGIYKLFYPNGKAYFEFPLLNGVWEGVQKSYYPNGTIMTEVSFKNDAKEGSSKTYYANGKLSLEGNYLNDLKQGTWKSYDENGILDSEEIYFNGLQYGLSKYYEDGKLSREIEFTNGERNGVGRYFGKSGELAFELYYDNGFITSYSYLDKNKRLLPRIYLPNFTGVVKAYYSSGVQSANIEVASGYYHGKYNVFNEKGILIYDSQEEYGYTNSITKTYFDNGKIRSEHTEAYDVVNGTIKEYYPDGKVRSEAVYENGNLHGPQKFYDQAGKNIETRIFYHGYIMDIKK